MRLRRGLAQGASPECRTRIPSSICSRNVRMTVRRSLAMSARIAAVLGIGSAIAHAAEPYDIPVILPLTGGGAYVGNGVKNDLAAVEIRVNADGGIRGQPVHFAFYDL